MEILTKELKSELKPLKYWNSNIVIKKPRVNARKVAYKGKKRPLKIKLIPYKKLFNKAVAVFQTHIRNRDKCCVIGRDIEFERQRCGGYLTCGHLISRGKRAVIFDTQNSNGQCQNHNGIHRHYPEIYNSWWIAHYGMSYYGDLIIRSRVNSYKWSREELNQLIKKYERPMVK